MNFSNSFRSVSVIVSAVNCSYYEMIERFHHDHSISETYNLHKSKRLDTSEIRPLIVVIECGSQLILEFQNFFVFLEDK